MAAATGGGGGLAHPHPLAAPPSAAASSAAAALHRIKRLDLMARSPDEQRAYAQWRLDKELKAERSRAAERAAASYRARHGGREPPLDTRRQLELAANEDAARVVTRRLAISGELKRRADKAGTPGFRAPEVLLGCTHQGPPVDVWSAGMVLLGLLTRSYPVLPGRDDWVHTLCLYSLWGDTFREAASSMGRHVAVWPVDPELVRVARSPVAGLLPLCAPDMLADPAFPAAFDLCLRLLHPDPERRLCAAAALQCHPFFTATTAPAAAGCEHDSCGGGGGGGGGGGAPGLPSQSSLSLPSGAPAGSPQRLLQGLAIGGVSVDGGAGAAVAATGAAWLHRLVSVQAIAEAYCATDEAAAVAALVEEGRRQRAEHRRLHRAAVCPPRASGQEAVAAVGAPGGTAGAVCGADVGGATGAALQAPAAAGPNGSLATRTGDADSHRPSETRSSGEAGAHVSSSSGGGGESQRAGARRCRPAAHERQSGGSERGARHRLEEAAVRALAVVNIDDEALRAQEESSSAAVGGGRREES